MSEWIGVDFDGVLATYEIMQGKQLGEPVSAMIQRVKSWHNEGKVVRVFTARAGDGVQKKAVEDWLAEQGLAWVEVTNVKAFGMVELWDDRAVRVRKNTGKPCQGCRSSNLSAETDC